MLMCALDVSKGVEVQRACPLGLDAAEDLIHAPEDAALRLGVTAVPVLTRRAPYVAVGALWAHPDAEEAREDGSGVDLEGISCAEWVARRNEPPHVLLIRGTYAMVTSIGPHTCALILWFAYAQNDLWAR
jgi:hypothetical protein